MSAFTEHVAAKYLAHEKRDGVALCLSGGGYRSALFHLGALRRLNELGVLSQVDTVTSVSGGSILSAFLAHRLTPWPASGEVFEEWDSRIAAPFKRVVARNIRTLPLLSRLLPWRWFGKGAVWGLEKYYGKLVNPLRLTELPVHPHFVFCATDLSYGVNFTFTRDQLYDYQIGHATTPADWYVSQAVAASSCFPPVFNPMPLGVDPEKFTGGKDRSPKRNEIVRALQLSDGGLYDNMGLEPVWKSHATVLVSDGGATFDFGADKGFLWRLARYQGIVSRQASAVRKRWLISNFIEGELSGSYFGIGSSCQSYGVDLGYPDQLVDEVISEVRTDLDAFSDAEVAVLENHGYLLAEAAVTRHVKELISGGAWDLIIPNPEWMDPDKVRSALAGSHKTKLPLGRWRR